MQVFVDADVGAGMRIASPEFTQRLRITTLTALSANAGFAFSVLEATASAMHRSCLSNERRMVDGWGISASTCSCLSPVDVGTIGPCDVAG